jgi:hypothetical protein
MGAREAIAKLLTGIRTFHSSPHDFDAFDISKAGTGEGHAMYGHGLYSAENPAVSGRGGQYWDQFTSKFPREERTAAECLRASKFDPDGAIGKLANSIAKDEEWLKAGRWDNGYIPSAEEVVGLQMNVAKDRRALDLLRSGQIVGPRTYELNIKNDPAVMLNWDKTLDKQPDVWDRIPTNTRSHIDELYDQRGFNSISDAPEAYTGKDLYKALTHHDVNEGFPSFPGENWDNPKANASAFLDQVAGVPGIKYLDQGSRLFGDAAKLADRYGGRQPALEVATQNYNDRLANPDYAGPPDRIHWRSMMQQLETPESSNYVSFNPARDIDIMKKYGVIGAPAGALAADPAMMGSTYDQSQYPAEPPP